MAPPSFLNTSFAFQSLSGVTDVQTIIDAIITMITVTLPATPTDMFPNGERWTFVSGTRYKSPVDAAGRFMEVEFVRGSATSITWTVRDPLGLITAANGVILLTSPSPAEIFAGPGHLMVQMVQSSAWEVGRAFMTDPTPEPLGSYPVYVYGGNRRDQNTNFITNGLSFVYWMHRFYGGTVTTSHTVAQAWALPYMPIQDTANTHLRTQAGSDIAAPYFTAIPSSTGADDWRNGGKLFQTIVVDSSYVAGSDITVPIDTGTSGIFRVTRMTGHGARQFAVRKG